MSNHLIPLSQAIQMTTLFRQQRDMILKPVYAGKNMLPIAETFDRSAIESLLNLPDCRSIRIYHSMDQNLQLHAIIVGVDSADKDILPTTDSTATDVPIAENSRLCPPYCTTSPLNP
jgi:hypothetical protein